MRSSTTTFKLSVRVEALFPGMTLERQMAKVAEAGYQGFEFGDWRAPDAAAIVKLKNKLRLECACIVGNKSVNPVGMGLCDPREREGFLAEIRASLEAAKRFETSKIVVLTGFKIPGLTREAQHASVVEGLRRANELASKANVQMIVEIVNTRAKVEPLNPKGNNHNDYYLDHCEEAFATTRKIASPFVKILFDLYHVQIMDGNLIQTIRENISEIAHIHVGDVPDRHEPGTGEIHFGKVFQAIHQAGFREFVAMEYVPSRDAVTTLREAKMLAMRSI